MNQSEKLYKPIIKDGTHLAKSRNTPGAVRGTTLSNKNNQLDGQAEWIEMEVEPQYIYVEAEPQEEDGLSEETKEAIRELSNAIVELGFLALQEYVFPPIKAWASDTAVPQIKKAGNWITGKKNPPQIKKAKSVHKTATSEDSTSISMPAMLLNGVDIAYDKYTIDSNNSDVQREFLEIAVHSAMLVDKIKKFLVKYSHNDVIVSKDFLEWQLLVERVTSKNLVDSINLILQADVNLINKEHSIFLADILGCDVIRNGQFVPIKNDRFTQALSLKSVA